MIRLIEGAGGSVTFARFMESALTDPESGYYAGADRFLGPSGDFTTAPRMVPAFNRAVARMLADLIDSIPDPRVTVVEVGAGEGDMAAGILRHWIRTRPDLRSRVAYRVDDVGRSLRDRQLSALVPARAGGWDVGAWDPEGEDGVASVGLVITNELLDALPVHVIDVTGEVPLEAWVSLREGPGGVTSLREEWRAVSAVAAEELRRIAPGASGEALRQLSADGFIELRPGVREFLRHWAESFEEVGVLTIDYGEWLAGPRDGPLSVIDAEYGMDTASGVDRHRRSLRAYLRHQATLDLYSNVGRQDLTADVDFRALALHGTDLGYEAVLYSTLASFLRAAGAGQDLDDLDRESPYSLDRDIEVTPLASLLADDGVGALFKVMLQVRDRGGE
jgi:SAM-dependent MidA family methyltransferase